MCSRSWNKYQQQRKRPGAIRAFFLFVSIKTRLLAGILENVLSKVVFDACIVVQCFVISRFQQLLATLPELLADILLHAWVGDLALSSLLLRDQLDDLISGRDFAGPHDRQHAA